MKWLSDDKLNYLRSLAGNPDFRAACRAFNMAFSTKVSPVSSTLACVKSDCGNTVTCQGDSNSESSLSFAGFPVARTTRIFMSGQKVSRQASRWSECIDRKRPAAHSSVRAECLKLQRQKLTDASGSQIEKLIKLMTPESVTFSGALHLDETAAIVHDDIHVRLGFGIFPVVEVQHRNSARDTH